MVVAALAAEGVTTISNVMYIDRGYQDIDRHLADLGAVINRSLEDDHALPDQKEGEPVEWSAAQVPQTP